MIKIELSTEVLEKHNKYFEETILPKIIEGKNRTYSYDQSKASTKIKKITDFSEFDKQHIDFIKYVESNWNNFAVGRLSDFKKINANINRLFPLVSAFVKSGYKNDKNESYSDYIYKLFGYENFKVKDLYYYVKKKAVKNTGEDKLCEAVRNEIVKLLILNYPKLKDKIESRLSSSGKKLSRDEFEKDFKNLTEINVTMDNFKQIEIFKDDWNDYAFVMESGIRVCPYCNRQYITPIFTSNGKMRADIDHFLPKSKYPYFSMSLYNLVPVCKSCNQSLKRDKKTEFEDMNPYEYSLNDYFKFKADTLTSEISIDGIHNKSKEISKHLDMFKIEALYNYHRNQVDELIKKRITYPESYIKKLCDDINKYFDNKYYIDEDDVKQLIVGYIKDKSKLNDEAFLKLRRDIAEQLGFMDSKIDDSKIEELKQILVKRKYC